MFGGLVQAFESVTHATGVDKAIHSVTGGARLFEKDGTANPSAFAVKTFEHVAHETGLDKVMHSYIGKGRLFDRNGSFRPDGAVDIVEHLAKSAIKLPEDVSRSIGMAMQDLKD